MEGVGEWISADVSRSGSDPIEFLHQQICPEVSVLRAGTIPELAATPEFQGKLVWVEGVGISTWSAWSDFLKAYAHVCRNTHPLQRTVLVVLLCGQAATAKVPDELGLLGCDFRNSVDHLDMLGFALANAPVRFRYWEHRVLLTHIVARIAQWDLMLADRLLATPLRELLDPFNLLREYARERGWTPETPQDWGHGTLDGPFDAPVVHSALLEICGDEARCTVRQRLWAAQVAVLMPLIGDRRLDILVRYRGCLNLPVERDDGSLIHNPFDLDVGDLATQLNRPGQPRAARRQIRTLRHIRNQLAHMEALRPDDALHRVLFERG